LGSLHVTRAFLQHDTRTRQELIERATAVFDGVASGRLKLNTGEVLQLAEAVHADTPQSHIHRRIGRSK
jgi:NADPH2:quinone reductase